MSHRHQSVQSMGQRFQQIKVAVRSSWGSNYNVGMRHIGVYSRERELLEVEDITIRKNKESLANHSASQLKSESKECFIERMEELEIELSLRVSEEEDQEVFYMKVLNYDKSTLEEGKGVKDIEVYKDGQLEWLGEVNKGSRPTFIPLHYQAIDLILQQDQEVDTLPVQSNFQQSMSYFNQTNKGRLGQTQLVAPEPKVQLSESTLVATEPQGRRLVITIDSTWGDKFYVGLSGLELFDQEGNLVSLMRTQIESDPSDINILEEYQSNGIQDPRQIHKVINRKYITTDDSNMWLAPFNYQGRPNVISIDLQHPTTLSMIRVWNYNKSRIHSYRGVKDMRVHLDGTLVF